MPELNGDRCETCGIREEKFRVMRPDAVVVWACEECLAKTLTELRRYPGQAFSVVQMRTADDDWTRMVGEINKEIRGCF